MMKIVALLAVTALAGAAEISSTGGDIVANVNRRQSINVGELADTVSELGSSFSQMRESLDNGIGAASANLQNDAVSRAVSNEGRLATLEANLASLTSTITDQLAAAQASVNAQITEAASNTEAALTEASDATEAAMANLENQTEAALTASAAAVGQMVGQMNGTLNSMRTAIDNSRKVYIWSGGCSSHPGSNWNWYCLNRQLYNQAAPWFTKHDNQYFRALRTGYFRLNFFTIQEGSGWKHTQVELAGQTVYYSYNHVYHCWWTDNTVEQTFLAQAGQKWRLRTYTNCGHAYHHGGAASGGNGYHSRISTEYVGH